MLEALIPQQIVGDRRNLIQGFALLLAAIEQAGALLAREGMVNPVNKRQRGNDSFGFDGDSEDIHELDGQGMLPDFAGSVLDKIRDNFTSYEEKKLADGRLLRRYETGNVRILNPETGVIQEEAANGNFVLSLPDGKVIFQEHPGHPLLLYDTWNLGMPRLARVAMMKIGDATEATPAFTFGDEEATFVVDMNSLRYFRIPRTAGATARQDQRQAAAA